MLGLRAVDVDGVCVGDGDHEHGCVGGLAVVVFGVAAVGIAVGAAVGVTRNGLEVGEDGVVLGLAGVVGGGGGDGVVLNGVSDSGVAMRC